MNLNLSVPINSVSFGSVSYNILKELYNRGISPNVFPIGNVDLSSFDRCQDDFKLYLQSCIQKAPTKYKKEYPEFRLWHIGGSDTSHSTEQSLLTFLETDSPTPFELNVLSNQKNVFVTSEYTKEVMVNNGLSNVQYLPLGFDGENYRRINKRPYDSGIVVHGIFGKWEPKRKHTDKALRLWVKKYGNNPAYRLHLHCYNSFFDNDPVKCAQINQNVILQCFEGKSYWNVNVINTHLKTLTEYNQLLNSVDVVIDGGGNENWGLPAFHAAALGKHLVTVNSNGVKSWANEENSVLVEPNGKEECYDSIFFHKGNVINQGNFFTVDEGEFLTGIEKATDKFKTNPLNESGLKLQTDFTWSKTVDSILESLK